MTTMKTVKLSLMASAVLFAAPAIACDYPAKPEIPDGSTAPKEDMLSASAEVKDYLAAVDEYLNCIEAAERDAVDGLGTLTEEELARRNELLDQKFEAANEEKMLVGERFNEAVRAYNAARAEAGSD